MIFKDFVLVIDANFPNQAEEVVALIRSQTDKPIKYIFDTHHHGDHADGNIIYKESWGLRSLAYPIKENRKAFYEFMNIELPQGKINDLNNYKMNNINIRASSSAINDKMLQNLKNF